MTDLSLHTAEDERSQIKLRAQEQTVWLTQWEMAELFGATKQNISLHLKNVFEDGELDAGAVVKESLTVQMQGNPAQLGIRTFDTHVVDTQDMLELLPREFSRFTKKEIHGPS